MKNLLVFTTLLFSTQVFSRPFCVAHRALGYGQLENSLAALTAASRSGAEAIEFDLHHTKDGKTVIYHDKKLDRDIKGKDCPIKKEVHEIHSKEIRALCRLVNDEVVPTFDEALQELSKGESRLFIELKDTVTEDDFKLIKKYYSDRPEKIFIISFDEKILAKVTAKQKTDDYFSKTKTILLKKYGYFGSLKEIDGIDAKYIHKSKVKRLIKRGKIVGVYTKDTSDKIIKYLLKGAQFITTNESKKCEDIIDQMFP
ncbi:MAG: hypothetical protein EP319_05400 [Deltaproteobacteria bacterium]|nr:MAG: hypothetical protein EP319_05400 [Deltaproteobacteria bacterium]